MGACSHTYLVLGSLGWFRDARGWDKAALPGPVGRQMHASVCTRTQRAEPLHKALLLRNQAWGATSTVTYRKLPPLRSATVVESMGRTPLGNFAYHSGALPRPSRIPPLPTPPRLSRTSEGRGQPARFPPSTIPGRGSLRIRVQSIVNLPPRCGCFLPPPAATHAGSALL